MSVRERGGPPGANVGLCLGEKSIPIYVGSYVDEQGNLNYHEMFELKQRRNYRNREHLDLAKWFWPMIGYNDRQANSAMPCALNFMVECREFTRQAMDPPPLAWRDGEGNLLKSLVALQIRDRTIKVENNPNVLRIDIG